MKEKIACIIAHRGYLQVEYNVPKKEFEKAGYQVITASTQLSPATAKDLSTTNVDILIKDLNVTDYAAIVIIGGPGALEELDNQTTYALCQSAVAHHIPIAAICIAPRILINAGVMQGRMITGWNEDNLLPALCAQHEVTYVPEEVVREDLFVTATGPQVALEFAEQIINLLHHRATI